MRMQATAVPSGYRGYSVGNAGYALSIFIPISFVCVLPYEAVRWAMIGVATVSSGLFLLLNFKGPIFDVAGAK